VQAKENYSAAFVFNTEGTENLRTQRFDGQPRNLRKVVSFMDKVPNVKLVEKVRVQIKDQPEAAWPSYIQELDH